MTRDKPESMIEKYGPGLTSGVIYFRPARKLNAELQYLLNGKSLGFYKFSCVTCQSFARTRVMHH